MTLNVVDEAVRDKKQPAGRVYSSMWSLMRSRTASRHNSALMDDGTTA
jgi:hypothetical protein